MNGRVLSTENILSNDDPGMKPKKKKIRNYSFQKSKRLPIDKMTEINGIRIPSMPGSCYHAIIATLARNKDKFCSWEKIIEGTHYHMRMYGGEKSWKKFINKNQVKSHQQRIKDNTHTLTRTGKDCYGYRLHEQGMCIYYFKDGAMLLTGGNLSASENGQYGVVFPDGRDLQTRYRGTTMTHKEYVRFLGKGLIDKTGKVLDAAGLKRMRAVGSEEDLSPKESESESKSHVCVILESTFDQHTAERLEKLGFEVEQAFGNELIGLVLTSQMQKLKADLDVKEVEISGE